VKRIRLGFGSLGLGLGVLATALGSLACEADIPVDSADENPAVLGPKGIIRGTLAYYGPPPCFRNGEVEGQVVLLLFDAANPPPPDGLASTALNFATVTGTKLFPNIAPPATGPGSTKSTASFCPSVDSPPINAATEWSMQQVGAGRFQVRGFYSRQGRWNPLFNFANLSLAGDVAGGALVDVRATVPRFATVEVGVPITLSAECARLKRDPVTDLTGNPPCDAQIADVKANKLRIPDTGFIREGIPVAFGAVLRSNRPYFHIDVGASTGFGQPPLIEKDFASNAGGASKAIYDSQRKPLTSAELTALGYITFPQDHLSTSQSRGACAANPDPNCDLFEFAQASFPQIRFKYGFAGQSTGDLADPAGADAWIAKNAVPAQAFGSIRRKYYGIDPKEFEADVPTSGKFMLTRNFDAAGKPEILRDNQTLEEIAQIAEIFPSVVLSKLQDDNEGNLKLPPRSQVDPIVVIQTITLKDWDTGPKAGQGSMKASSESPVVFGGLTNQTPIGATPPGSIPDPNHPLAKREGAVSQEGFTALVRPSVVCIYPQDDLRGTLVTPVEKDPNPDNPGATLVARDKILKLRANRVKQLAFGCLPPGYYSVNVVYPTGQAWSVPNLSGHCSYTAKFAPNEDCYMPNKNVGAGGFNWLDTKISFGGFDPARGFPQRPLLRSQSPFQYEDNGKLKLGTQPGNPPDMRTVTLPQVVVITPSDRCGHWQPETELACNSDAECPAPYKGACLNKKCDVNGDGKISSKPIWVNNAQNEDTSFDTATAISTFSANGLLDKTMTTTEDVNGNGKLDMHAPFVCSLPRDKWVSLPADKLLK